jgi:hypothetical protein
MRKSVQVEPERACAAREFRCDRSSMAPGRSSTSSFSGFAYRSPTAYDTMDASHRASLQRDGGTAPGPPGNNRKFGPEERRWSCRGQHPRGAWSGVSRCETH